VSSLELRIGVGNVSGWRLPCLTHRVPLTLYKFVVFLLHPLLCVVVQQHASVLSDRHLFVFEAQLSVVVLFHRRIKSEKFFLILHLQVTWVLDYLLAAWVALKQTPRPSLRLLAFLNVSFIA
jgi:hypothetical protein